MPRPPCLHSEQHLKQHFVLKHSFKGINLHLQKFTFAEHLLTLKPSDLDEFVSSSEQNWKNVALHHLLTNGPSAVNGCRQNESPKS